MPSPFPGMDPYLEEPGLWPDVHHNLITFAARFLTQQLRPKYYARVEERVYISDENDPGRRVIVPDEPLDIPPGTLLRVELPISDDHTMPSRHEIEARLARLHRFAGAFSGPTLQWDVAR